MARPANPLLDLVGNPDVRRFLTQRGGLQLEHELPDLIKDKLARLDEVVGAAAIPPDATPSRRN